MLVQVDMVLLGHFAHIKYGIAHAAQRGVDAQSGKVDNLLETQSLVIAHVHHFALLSRQVLHKAAHVGQHLLVG